MGSDKIDGFCYPYVTKRTPGKGLGVFAGQSISQGDVVWRHVPGLYVVFDEATFTAAIQNMSHADAVYELTHVFGLKEMPGCLIRIYDDGVLINHSNKANMATNNAVTAETSLNAASPHFVQDVTKALLSARYALVATRDIEIGEELTNDYANDVDDPPFYDVLCAHYGVSEEYLDDG